MSRREGVQRARQRSGGRRKGTTLADRHGKTPNDFHLRQPLSQSAIFTVDSSLQCTERRLSFAQLASSEPKRNLIFILIFSAETQHLDTVTGTSSVPSYATVESL
jgi:hypothetical protein